MSKLEELSNKKLEEAFCKTSALDANSQEFIAVNNLLITIFGSHIKLRLSNDYTVGIRLKHDSNDVLCFSCSVKQTECDVSSSQLSLFAPPRDASSGNPRDSSRGDNITEIKTRVSNA